MIRRFGEAPKKGIQYRARPGAYAILARDGRVLVTCQRNPDPDLQLPGGGIERDEATVPALHREVFEETGWSIASARKLGVFRRFVFMPEYDLWAEKLCHIYVARPVLRLGPPLEEAHEALWLDPEEAAHTLGNAGDRHFLQTYLNTL